MRKKTLGYVAAALILLSCAAAGYAAESRPPRNGLQLELLMGGDLWGYAGHH